MSHDRLEVPSRIVNFMEVIRLVLLFTVQHLSSVHSVTKQMRVRFPNTGHAQQAHHTAGDARDQENPSQSNLFSYLSTDDRSYGGSDKDGKRTRAARNHPSVSLEHVNENSRADAHGGAAQSSCGNHQEVYAPFTKT